MNDLSQYIFSGLTVGCVPALVALGVVLIASVTRVYNFAQGEYVMAGGIVTAWSIREGAAWPVAVVLASAIVALLALAQERLTVAPVRDRLGPLGMVVASLGVAVLLRGVALALFGSDPLRAPAFSGGELELLGARLSNQALWVWGVTGLALAGMVMLFRFTHLGRCMHAAAIDATAARLLGIRVGPLSMGAFVLAGALSGLVGAATVPLTFVSWDSGVSIGLTGFIAAAMAGFSKPGRAVAAGLGLGVVEALAAGYVSSSYRQAFVFGALLVYLFGRDLFTHDGVLVRAKRGRRAPHIRRAVAGATRFAPGHVDEPSRRRLRDPRALVPGLCFGAALLLPALPLSSRALDESIIVVLLSIGATGLSLVMGLAGQLSLGQGAFYLVGGYCTAILTAKHGWGVVPALGAAVALSAAVGTGVGWLTLRLRGFNLAIATLAVHLVLLIVVTQQTGLTGGELGTIGVPEFTPFGIDLSQPVSFYYVVLAALGGCLLVARNLARSRIGLGLRALGVDEDGAEALGLRTLRMKLTIFVVGSAMGGLAGALWADYGRFADPTTWDLQLTIDLITYVVVGGIGSIYGGALGAVALGTVMYFIERSLTAGSSGTVNLILSGVLLVVFVLAFPRGLAHAVQFDALQRRWRGASGPPPPGPALAHTTLAAPAEPGAVPPAGAPIVVVRGLSKRFGGFTAVDGLDLELAPGTITAMVGPNGAGKSTVINLLAGVLVPSDGSVELAGARIDGLHANEIARLGLVRTFQTPRLFQGLTARETVMLARDRYARGGWLGAALRLPRERRDQREAGEVATACLAVVGLENLADSVATSLPTGHQRLLDVARALAAEPSVVLLDEPAAGLDDEETAALGELIRAIAATGTAVLLVEHAMSLVMSVADRIVVLDQGRRLAEGPPEAIRRDERVVEVYLGAVPA